MDDDFFAPEVLVIPTGATVEWLGGGRRLHTVTFIGGQWDSGPLPAGDRFRVTFSSPGTYQYLCAEHPGVMGGEIVVREP